MAKENVSFEFRLNKIEETKSCLSEEIEHTELMSKKHKKICTTLNYVEHLNILTSPVTGRVSISAFTSLASISVGIASPAVRLKFCAMTTRIKQYNSIIKKGA